MRRRVFGDRLGLAQRYACLLRTDGIERGLLGPREAARIWDRHLLNCAALTELLPRDARVVDVGSGAGLPGLVLAIRRPDLRVDLVESLQRRVDFLTGAISILGLGESVRVVHGRAEDVEVRRQVGHAQWVTARAVAPLDRLVRWCLPLLRGGGRLLAVKGTSAAAEVAEHRKAIAAAAGGNIELVTCGRDLSETWLTVVVVRRATLRTRTTKGTQ